MMTLHSMGEPGTLVVVAPELDGPEGGADRAAALACVWGGPVALVVLGPPEADRAAELPAGVELIAAGGEVRDALQLDASPSLRLAAAHALLGAAAHRGPLRRAWYVASGRSLPLLPSFAEATFPGGMDVELLDSAGVPDADRLWEDADAIAIPDDARLYALAAGQPALPVRVVPAGAGPAATAALRAFPAFGGAPRVSVVVPVRGQAELVVRMAESVLERTAGLLELILVDDASPDRTLERLERLSARDPRVRLFVNPRQRGFAASCNRGITAARGDVVIALNADTVVTHGWAERLARHLRVLPSAGIVGPVSNRVSGLQHVAPVDYDERTLAGLTRYGDKVAEWAPGAARGVVRLTGLCVAFARRALRRVGGFDARFFPGNFEDDDYCMRLLAGGLVPYCADDTFIHHEGSKSFALEARAYRQILEDNWSRFKAKWNLPADRPVERHYSPEELPLRTYVRETHFIAPWRAMEPVGVEVGDGGGTGA